MLEILEFVTPARALKIVKQVLLACGVEGQRTTCRSDI